MSRYKIVKVVSKHTGNDLYKVYRHKFWVFWEYIDFRFSIKEAEHRIEIDKEEQSWKKAKPEVVGYY